MEFLAEEIVREILLKLPTRDAVRCCCVSRLWRGIISEPSFRSVHARASHVISGSGAAAEALLVSQNLETTTAVFSVSSGKAMCCFTDLARGYRPTNACHGLLCLTSSDKHAPLFVCNPVTGERLHVPAPPLETDLADYEHMFAMGLSPSTREYKLFRFSFAPETYGGVLLKGNHVDMYTLRVGRSGGWRRHPRSFNHDGVLCGVGWSPPALVAGKMYVLLTLRPRWEFHLPDRMLEVDVASETHRTHHLPQYPIAWKTVADAFELRGRLCFAMHVLQGPSFEIRLHLHLWSMPSSQLRGVWEPHYSFYCPVSSCPYDHFRHCGNQLRAAWIDENGMLCYVADDHVYKYDTNNNKHSRNVLLVWDHQHQLLSPLANDHHHHRLDIYCGYHPSLLSPHDLVGASSSSSLP